MNTKLRDMLLMVNNSTFTWENADLDYVIKEIILEFLQEAYKDGDLCKSCSNSLSLRLKDKELEG